MIYLPIPKEFSFTETLRFLTRNEKECLHTVKGETVLKVLEIDGELVLFSINFINTSLQIIIHTPNFSDEVVICIKKYVQHWFDLEANLSDFYKTAQKDEVLANLCQRFYGLRMVGMPDLFESLVWSIIGQQINLNFAYSLKERLVKNFGKSLVYDGKEFFALPTPERLASLSLEDFLPHQFSRSKAQYILNISKAFAEGDLAQKDLEQLPFDEIREKLVKIKGIGNWTANYSMMKSLKNYDAFPVEDVGLHNAVKNQYGLEEKPRIKDLHSMAEKWAGWKGYATFYFWHSLLG
ncbi:DNA-3-methyladenine glycosylase family protein [Emticicia sp. SJ17W-69]|uniref:DNA-3-methyladenine glycosylase family protein n=1 Tax=Emticicia sp. SJ17W-69 TaxID=3421657 RepID=UPI003EBF6D93